MFKSNSNLYCFLKKKFFWFGMGIIDYWYDKPISIEWIKMIIQDMSMLLFVCNILGACPFHFSKNNFMMMCIKNVFSFIFQFHLLGLHVQCKVYYLSCIHDNKINFINDFNEGGFILLMCSYFVVCSSKNLRKLETWDLKNTTKSHLPSKDLSKLLALLSMKLLRRNATCYIHLL